MGNLEFIVGDLSGRIDKILSSYSGFSRSKIQEYIKNECVFVDGEMVTKPNATICAGASVLIKAQEKQGVTIKPSDIKLDIIYEDEDLIIINKQAGLTVHPGAGNHSDTMVNALIYHYGKNLSTLSGDERPGIVHRLDRDTTGLMLVAKNDRSHEALAKAIENREVKRLYKAFVWGDIKPSEGTISTNMDRSRADRKRMAVCRAPKGKVATTHYNTLKNWLKISLAECKLDTGRTHQIRVHMSHIGNSIVGDQVYGNNARKILHNVSGELKEYLEKFRRQALHSYKLEFSHPISGERMSFEADLPKDLSDLEELLDNETNKLKGN